MSVLVLAGDRDPMVDAVVELLTGRNVVVFRCDSAWFPIRLRFDAQVDQDRWKGRLRTAHRQFGLSEVRAVWYRSPTAFVLPTGLSGPERRHAGWEAKFGLGGVLADLPAFWVNHPHREGDLAWKARQLTRAAACGLAVPATLITNDAEAVREFADRHGELVIKPLAFNSTTDLAGRVRGIHTHALTADDLADLGGIDATAHLFQERIDKTFEVRLTIVGREPFAAAIQAGSEAAWVDWRTDPEHLRFEPIEIPAEIMAAAGRFMDSYGIDFAAFDFAITRDERWVMFECNGAAAQWGFVEDATGLPITAALAALLANPPHTMSAPDQADRRAPASEGAHP